jgi:hypothetical protein
MKHPCLAIFVPILWFAAAAGAQTQGGATLNGTVTDPSGASVPGTKVNISNTATGLSRSTSSNEAGLYTFSGLPVGTYQLSFEKQGFKSARLADIPLQVGAVATMDVKLEVGTAQESVSVEGAAPIVETTRSSSAATVTEKAVANLPVNGRNFIDFTLLTPGVVRDVRGSGDLSFAGQRGTVNSLLVDGADSNNLFFGQATGRTGFRPYAFSEDAVPEFQVNTVGYPAEIGRAGGGAINMVTSAKSPTRFLRPLPLPRARPSPLCKTSFSPSPRNTNTRGYQIIQTLSFNSGRHSFKAGADINLVKADNYFPGYFAGGYVFPSYVSGQDSGQLPARLRRKQYQRPHQPSERQRVRLLPAG